MRILLHKTLLSNTSLLRRYAEGLWPDLNECRRLCFIQAREHDSSLPDHAYKNRWAEIFHGCSDLPSALLTALSGLAEQHLQVNGGRVRVQNDALASWQNVLPFVPPLPILAFALYRKFRLRGFDCAETSEAVSSLAKTALPSIHDPGLEDLIAHQGLRDLHVHLNGSTEADWVWQDALKRPTQFARLVVRALKNDGKELTCPPKPGPGIMLEFLTKEDGIWPGKDEHQNRL